MVRFARLVLLRAYMFDALALLYVRIFGALARLVRLRAQILFVFVCVCMTICCTLARLHA